jgi:hypothetical protein
MMLIRPTQGDLTDRASAELPELPELGWRPLVAPYLAPAALRIFSAAGHAPASVRIVSPGAR